MGEALKNRAAAIRDYLGKLDPPVDPPLSYRYSVTAARWEALRLRADRGGVTPGNDRRFQDLTNVLRALTKQTGLRCCTVKDCGPHGIPGLTDPLGFLPRDASRIICADWQEAAEGWHGC